MGNPITLADLKIGREAITVELIELHDQEAERITWPKRSLAGNAER
jgi:preprotein translocase subunit SecE